jgi:hypothetical protein
MTLPEDVRKEAERLTRLGREGERSDEGGAGGCSARDGDPNGEAIGGGADGKGTRGGSDDGDGDGDVASEAVVHRERRAELLAEHGYTARVREDTDRDVLVLYPTEWTDEDGLVDVTVVEDVDRGFEVPLSGPGDDADWAAVEAHNRAAAELVAAEHGAVHGENAHAFADFMGNHYAKPVERATYGEVEEFLYDYFPRNAWPTDEQRAVVAESVELVRAAAEGE